MKQARWKCRAYLFIKWALNITERITHTERTRKGILLQYLTMQVIL